MTFVIAGRELSFYELFYGRGARWYWDRRYMTEVEQEAMQRPLCPTLLQEIDTALGQRASEIYRVDELPSLV